MPIGIGNKVMHRKKCSMYILVAVVVIALSPAIVNADLVTFELDNIFTDRGGQMTGQFTWTYMSGDFENGIGEFTWLDVPHTAHGLDDLNITIETTQIEITLDGSFHDDGVDVALVLLEPFSLSGPASLDLDPMESKYSIGGNGFIDGIFVSGAVTPIAVPEPSSAAMLGAIAIVGAYRRRSRPVGCSAKSRAQRCRHRRPGSGGAI
jgi:hypothetical protein